ncbi:MAG: sigma-54-dependent Fis family transcriptional regulator [Saprospiraceae bacterium]|nr:sigma-54-dependent Fis family transcriptional regulator [Saprospiraceae bacterium]
MQHRNYLILIVDDDPEFHRDIRFAFRKQFEFEGALNVAHLEQQLASKKPFDLVLLDLVLDNNSKEKIGLELITYIKKVLPATPIIVVTNENDVSIVVSAMNKGAQSFLYKKDYNTEQWGKTFIDVLIPMELAKENNQLKQEISQVKAQYEYKNPPETPLLGKSPAMENIRKTLKILADEPEMTVLITGETGVGKGVAANFLHYNSSKRCDHPFEEIHISNIPKSLIESTLFGAKKGTFTDAKEDIKGRLHMADKGIVFLDEIGDLDLENQVKLLQFIQTKTIRPIGTNKDIKLDVQIVAATNKNLRAEVAKGNFREDLYQRLKVFPIEIPPLRERKEDLLDLLLYFTKMNEQELRSNFEEEVLDVMLDQYTWIGNIRELENTIKGIKIKQKVLSTEKVTMACLPDDIIVQYKSDVQATSSNTTVDEVIPTPDSSITDIEERHAWTTLNAIERALVLKNGVKKRCGRASQIQFFGPYSLSGKVN